MFDKILIANRGEIAVRIARTCRELSVATVAVFSDADSGARHVVSCDESVALPGTAPSDTYLNGEAILEAARRTGAEAVHPGYGFLAESPAFAAAVEEAGVTWIGPPSEVIRAVGDKIEARRIAEKAGVSVVPGLLDPVEDLDVLRAFAEQHGYPLVIKAAGGGGGRGLKLARSAAELEDAFATARREAEAYFGSRDVYAERYLEAPKHLEVQILAPGPDEAIWLGVRDCSFQRRHQKLIEETPPPRFGERAPDMGAAAVALSRACGYVNAGTVEMLADAAGDFFFLEVNSRLQVEHTVTEMTHGVDLVAGQLAIASGEPLGYAQGDLNPRGHAIECRINAEDPARGFAPAPGLISRYEEPGGMGVRVDSGYGEGDTVPDAYDSLVAKLITWGRDREEARGRMLRALGDMTVEGLATTIPLHRALLEMEEFITGSHTTRTVEESGVLESLAAAAAEAVGAAGVLLVEGRPVKLWNPAMAGSAAAALQGGLVAGRLVAPMQGTVLRVAVAEGQEVSAGDPVVVVEAMKMETTVAALVSGRVTSLEVSPGDTVSSGQVLAVVE